MEKYSSYTINRYLAYFVIDGKFYYLLLYWLFARTCHEYVGRANYFL